MGRHGQSPTASCSWKMGLCGCILVHGSPLVHTSLQSDLGSCWQLLLGGWGCIGGISLCFQRDGVWEPVCKVVIVPLSILWADTTPTNSFPSCLLHFGLLHRKRFPFALAENKPGKSGWSCPGFMGNVSRLCSNSWVWFKNHSACPVFRPVVHSCSGT